MNEMTAIPAPQSPVRSRKKRIRGNSDTRNRILKAARIVVTRNGVEKATIRRIAREANVSIGLINQYFGTKSELNYELFRSGNRPLSEYLRGHLDQFETPLQLMMAACRDYLARDLKHPELTRQIMSDTWLWSAETEATFCTSLGEMIDIVCDVLEEKFYQGQPQLSRTATQTLFSTFAFTLRVGLQRNWPLQTYLDTLEPYIELITLGLEAKLTKFNS